MDRSRTKKDKARLDKIIGRNIRTERELRRITRDELAEVADLTVSHLGLIERGERGATPVTLEKVVRAFGITIDSLFKERVIIRGASYKEKSPPAEDAYGKKFSTLTTQLNEAELEFLTYIIKGMIKMRTDSSPK